MKKFCHLCGGKYVDDKIQPWECTKCGNLSYSVSSPCAEIALFNEKGQILLAVRGIEPNKGKHDLPGGFLSVDEMVEDGLMREVEEELGLSPSDYSKPKFVASFIMDGYVFSKEVLHTITFNFAAKIINGDKLKALDDVESIEFVDIDKIDQLDFSLSTYPEIIRKAYRLLFG